MLLSTASTFFFLFAVVATAAGFALLVAGIFARALSSDTRFTLGTVGCIVLFFGAPLTWVIADGGTKAQNIHDDLTNQGFTVVSIDTDRSEATVAHDNKLVDVTVHKDGYPKEYRAYLLCPVNVDMVVSSDNCEAK